MTEHTIVGGGIIGLLTAYYLVGSGQDVTVLERGNVGGESSWAGGGIISPLYPWRYANAVTQLAKWSQDRYPELIDQLSQFSDLDAEYVKSGLLILDANELPAAEQWAQKFGGNLLSVRKTDIMRIEPALHSIPERAVWMPDVAQVRNPRLLKVLKHYLLSRGVIIHEDIEILGFNVQDDRIQGLQTNKGDMSTSSVAIACGAWSTGLMKLVGLDMNIEPVKGQMILIKACPNLIQRIVLSQDQYIIPRIDGRVLVGSTLEHEGFNKDITAQAREQLLATALRLIPALSDYELEHQWAGLRPGSPDNVPTISRHPRIEGLYVNAGHFRNGVVTAPASAQLLTNIMLGQVTILDQGHYSLAQ